MPTFYEWPAEQVQADTLGKALYDLAPHVVAKAADELCIPAPAVRWFAERAPDAWRVRGRSLKSWSTNWNLTGLFDSDTPDSIWLRVVQPASPLAFIELVAEEVRHVKQHRDHGELRPDAQWKSAYGNSGYDMYFKGMPPDWTRREQEAKAFAVSFAKRWEREMVRVPDWAPPPPRSEPNSPPWTWNAGGGGWERVWDQW